MKIVVTSRQMQNFLNTSTRYFENCELILPTIENEFFKESELLSFFHGANVVIVGDDQVTPKVISSSSELELIVKWGSGTNSIDVDFAESKGIIVKNTPGLFGNSVAELAISFLLNMVRGTHITDREVRQGLWPKIEGNEIGGMKVGIFGFGTIGARLAEILFAFGSHVAFFDPNVENQSRKCLKLSSLEELAKYSDVLILTAPLNAQTTGIIDATILRHLGNKSFLINVARGPLIVQHDLLVALENGIIAGAALDVYETEPLNLDSGLLHLHNVLLGSHNGSNTREGNLRASMQALAIVNEYLKSKL